MIGRDRRAEGPAEGSTGNGVNRNRVLDRLETLDDAQVMELMADAYWRLFERFISFEGRGTTVPSVGNAN